MTGQSKVALVWDGITGKVARELPIGPVLTWARTPGSLWVSNSLNGVGVWSLKDPFSRRWQLPTVIPMQLALDDMNADGVDDAICRGTTGVLMAIHGGNGRVLWRYSERVASVAITVVDVSGDGIRDVLATKGPRMLAINGRNGSLLWGVTCNAKVVGVQVLVDDVVALDDRGGVYWVGHDGRVRLKGDSGVNSPIQLAPLSADRVVVMGSNQGVIVTRFGERYSLPMAGLVAAVGGHRDVGDWGMMLVSSNRLVWFNSQGGVWSDASFSEGFLNPPMWADINSNGRMDMVVRTLRNMVRVYEVRGLSIWWQWPYGNSKQTGLWDDQLLAYPIHSVSQSRIPPDRFISDGVGPARLYTPFGRFRKWLGTRYRLVGPTRSDRRVEVWRDKELHMVLTLAPEVPVDQAMIQRIETSHPYYQLALGIGVGSTLQMVRQKREELGELTGPAANGQATLSRFLGGILVENERIQRIIVGSF